MIWFEKGSIRLNYPKLVQSNHSELVKELFTSTNVCNDVVQEGSIRFDVLELVHKYPAHFVLPVKM